MKPTFNLSSIANGAFFAALTLIGIQSGRAQGTILFDTHVEGIVDVKAYGPYGLTLLSGEKCIAQLYVSDHSDGSYFPVGSPVGFGTGSEAGYIDGGEVTVPFFPALTPVYAKILYQRMEDDYGTIGISYPPIAVTLATSGTASDPQSEIGKLKGLYVLEYPLILRPISVSVEMTTNSVVLEWFDQGLASPYVFVPEEADSPSGPWRDISEGGGPWIAGDGSRYNPPNPLVLPKPDGTRFYRVRLTTETGP